MIQPAAPSRNSDKGSEPVSQEGSEPLSQQESELVSQQENETTRLSEDTLEDTVQMKACQALEKVKQLSDEALKRVTITKVMYICHVPI